MWEIGFVRYHCPWVPSQCSYQVVIFRDGKHPVHFISIVSDESTCYFSSNSNLKCDELYIFIALRTSAFLHKPLWVTCFIWSGVAVGLIHLPDVPSSYMHLPSGLCQGTCELPQQPFITGLMEVIGPAHSSPWGTGQRQFKNATTKIYRILWLDLRYPWLHILQWGTSAPVILHR